MGGKDITTILGLDYGTRRIGIATGQTITGTATPLVTLQQVDGAPDWTGIEREIERWQPDALVVGIPYLLDGNETDMTRLAEQFCLQLEQRFARPVYRINETLSSRQAEEMLKQNIKITQHNKGEIDRMAAAVIVQSWLDQQ